jgi:hypothetical protein
MLPSACKRWPNKRLTCPSLTSTTGPEKPSAWAALPSRSMAPSRITHTIPGPSTDKETTELHLGFQATAPAVGDRYRSGWE